MYTRIHSLLGPVILGKTDRTNTERFYNRVCGVHKLRCLSAHMEVREQFAGLSQFSPPTMGSGDKTQVVKLIGKHFYLLSYLPEDF